MNSKWKNSITQRDILIDIIHTKAWKIISAIENSIMVPYFFIFVIVFLKTINRLKNITDISVDTSEKTNKSIYVVVRTTLYFSNLS